MSRRFSRLDPGYVVALLLPLIGILPTLSAGVIDTADGPLHIQRIQAMDILLGQGNLWPRWVPWFHLGFGYPIFNFYPPGVFYLGGLLGQVGIPATAAFTIVAALAWVIGSIGVYHLAWRFFPAPAALLAAMLWSYAPSRLFEVWDQGSLPQMIAAALLPWLLSGIVAAAYAPTRRRVVAIALPLAGIILSHQPITFISALYVAPLAFIVPPWAARRTRGTLMHRYAAVFGGVALGGALAAAFLLPLFTELKFVQAAGGAEDTVDYLISNFLQPGEIFAQPGPMDLTDLRFELPTTLGLVAGLLAIPGLIALARRRQYGLMILLLLGLGFTLFMLLQASLPVWLAIPLFQQLRFPERFLRVGALLIALAGGASILLLPRRFQVAGLAVGLTVVLIAALPLVYPNQRFLPWDDLTAEDEIAFEVANYTWGTTSYDEFDPIWGDDIPLPLNVPEEEEYATNPLRIFVNRVDMARYADIMQVEQIDTATVRVTLDQPHAVRFHQYYYPGWIATLDGQPAEIVPDAQFGLITVSAPAGAHEIALAYVGTPIQRVGEAVTLASIALCVGLWLTGRRSNAPEQETRDRVVGARHASPDGALTPNPSPSRRGGPDDSLSAQSTVSANNPIFHPSPRLRGRGAGGEGLPPDNNLPPRRALIIGAAVVAFAVINTAILTPNTLLFRHRSPPDQPAAMQTPVGARFGDDFILLGYTLDQTSVTPGGLFSITLFWRPLQEIDIYYRPVVQLVNLPLTAAWGASEPFFPGGGHSVGYPPDRFASEVHELGVFADAPPYVARVSVQMVDAASGEPLRLPDGSDRVLLDPLIRIEGSGTPVDDVLNTRFGDSVALQCVDVTDPGDHLDVTLHWRVLQPLPADVRTFIHALDADGALLTQADGPTLNGEYPPDLWLPNQNLSDVYTLPAAEGITQLAVGLYRPADNARLAATQNGAPLPDNRLLIPSEGASCQP